MNMSREFAVKRWEEIKPIFLKLYHDEDDSLDEVRRKLEQYYHFKASKSAFTRQIGKWNAFKNYKASDKHRLAFQRINGHCPEVDLQGRPIKWDRVYRATRDQGIERLHQNSPSDASPEHGEVIAPAAPMFSQPVDYDTHTLGLVVDIWRQSTFQYASRDPSAPSYRLEHSLYSQLMQGMTVITQSAKFQWPKREIDNICNEMPTLVQTHPAMACDLLTFLTARESPESFKGCKSLEDQLFTYICCLSQVVLPQTSTLRRLTSYVNDKQAFTRLGAAIAKAKLDAMWNSRAISTRQPQHGRPFFRQVLTKAIEVLEDYGEFELAYSYLEKLSDSDTENTSSSSAYARVFEKQSISQELIGFTHTPMHHVHRRRLKDEAYLAPRPLITI